MILHRMRRLASLEPEVGTLRAEDERLREQTRQSSRNSSPPPSGDAPSAPPRERRKPTGQLRGAQPGPKGQQRKLYPVEPCRHVTAHRPSECRAGGTAWFGDDPPPYRPPVIELPEVPPRVDEYRLPPRGGPHGGEMTRAQLPAEGPASGYGPRRVATVGWLRGPYRPSERPTPPALGDFYPVEGAWGPIDTLRQEVSQAVAKPGAAAAELAQVQEVAPADETGWAPGTSEGHHPPRRQAWWWVWVTRWVTVFPVHRSRGQAAAKGLLGELAGYWVTDRWRGDGGWPLSRRQLCWAPLPREFPKVAERGGESHAMGEGWLEQARKLFELWHRVRDGTFTREGFAAAVVGIRAAVQPWLAAGAAYEAARGDKSARARTARTCRELLKVEEALGLFVRVAGVEPTNNVAERALRPAVIGRRTRLGTQSALGSQFVARMLTVTLTLRSQQRPVLEYLTAACEAARQGMPALSLGPDPALLEQEHHLAIAA